jgi:hypothetical protein
MNYLDSYSCSKCSATGLKLWRGVHLCSDFLCTSCAVAKEYPRHIEKPFYLSFFDEDGYFTFASGYFLGDMLPAVPSEDGRFIYGFGAIPNDRVIWWNQLFSYADPALEIRCLRNLLKRTMTQHFEAVELWLKERAKR